MTMLSLTTESTINSEGCAPIVQSNKTTLGGMNEKRKWMNEDTPTKSRMNEKRTWMNKDGLLWGRRRRSERGESWNERGRRARVAMAELLNERK